jgi:hypothetical protein
MGWNPATKSIAFCYIKCIYYAPASFFFITLNQHRHYGGGIVAPGVSCYAGERAVASNPRASQRLTGNSGTAVTSWSGLEAQRAREEDRKAQLGDRGLASGTYPPRTGAGEWLFTSSQERRKVEDAYVAGLRKLSRKPLPESGGDLGYSSSHLILCDSRLTLNQHIQCPLEEDRVLSRVHSRVACDALPEHRERC